MVEKPNPRPKRPALLLIGGAVALLLVAAIGWTALWRFAAGEAQAVLDAWMIREAAVGHVWTCPGRTIGGFPFSVRMHCDAPRFAGDVAGTHTEGTLGGFEATAAVYHPTEIRADLIGPFAVKTDDGRTALTVGWTAMHLVLAGLPTAVGDLSVAADDVAVSGTLTGLGAVAAKAQRVSAGVRQAADRTDAAYDFSLAASGAAVPILDTVLGGTTPSAVEAAGTLTQGDFTAPGTPVERIERWRAAGGHVDLEKFGFTRGTMRLEASGGPLTIDPAHRPQGRLDARVEGFEPVLRRLGVNPGLVAIGGLLGGVLGGRSQGGGGGLRLPVGFDHGLLVVGPVRTSVTVPALY